MRGTLCSAAIVAALAMSACGGAEPASTTSDGGAGLPFASAATFSYALRSDPGNLDPAMSLEEHAMLVWGYTYDKIVALDVEGRVQSNLAESWDATPRRIDFRLRQGVTCADGSDVTATTLKRNLDYIGDPRNRSPFNGLILPRDLSVTADDARGQLTLRVGEPQSLLLQALAMVPIACGEGLDDRRMLVSGTSGSGPFVLAEAAQNDRYVLERRDGYRWGPDGTTTSEPGVPAEVVLRVVNNQTTAANMLLAGDLSAARVNSDDEERLRSAGLSVQTAPTTTLFAFLNQAGDRPGADPAVRAAFAAALDRDALASLAGADRARVADSFLTTAPACDDSAVGDAFPSLDRERAAQTLEQAGWREGSDGIRERDGRKLSLSTVYNPDEPGFSAMAQLMRSQASEVGIDLRLRPLPQVAIGELQFGSGDWDLLPLAGIGTGLPNTLVGFFDGPTPPDGVNFASIANDAYAPLVAEAQRAGGARACEFWTESESALVEAADVLPVVQPLGSYWATPSTSYAVGANGPVPTSVRMHEAG